MRFGGGLPNVGGCSATVRIRDRHLPEVGEGGLLAFRLERDLASVNQSAQGELLSDARQSPRSRT